jgi:gliding motility-associated-like protein
MLSFKFLDKNYVLVFILLLSLSAYSQNEAAIWYFGDYAGLDFNSGAPVVLSDGQLNTTEGCSTISNSNGQLLFYSDGITVWDKNHNVMPNGTGLTGDPSSSQSGLIVPNPSDSNIYYIFTVAATTDPAGLQYSVVDMSLNNGNGDVVANQKNINLMTPSTEKVTAVMHSNDQDIWIMTHGWDNDEFVAYLITSTGVNTTPVVSNVGSVHSGDVAETIGYMKFSPDGERLALAKYFGDTFVEVFDFDNATGIVSNPIHIDGMFHEGDSNGTYGLEFSIDSQLLYVSDVNFFDSVSSVHQFNVGLDNEQDVNNSNVILYSGPNMTGALQVAIDGKIYICNSTTGNLDAIENVNVIGTGCNYIIDAVNLQDGISRFGLPPFIQSFFSVAIEYENTCLGDTTVFNLASTEDVISVEWDFGDGNTSTELSPSHVYLSSGDYLVQLTVETADEIKTFERNLTIFNVPIAYSVSDFEACDDSSNDNQFEFNLTTKDIEVYNGQSQTEFTVNYFASMQDAENHENILPNTYVNTSNNQEIFVKIYNDQNYSCYDITSFELVVNEFPIINPVEDIITCNNEVVDNSQTLIFGNITPTVLGNQSDTVFEVSYHLNAADADSGSSALPNVYSTETNPQEIFYRIQNIESPECYEISSFNVFVDGQIIAYPPDNLYVCDDESNDGFETFDLTERNDQIINNQVGDFVITFYLDEFDALNSDNAIGNMYTNTIGPETIYARVERADNSNCFDITSFDIDVVYQPVFDFEPLYYICSGEDVTLTVPSGYDGYLWSNGATTNSITVTEAGNYDITVLEVYALDNSVICERTETIQVVESDEAVFQEFEISDWTSGSNSITVFVEGIGDYEYSLDNVNFQDSNVFTHLIPGEYDVYIRDKNGCGTIIEEVYLMYYPKYFTPNGDAYHPLWQIKFAYYEPNMEIQIFNRYGKLLLSLDPRSAGWDGTYNGKLMPADDYWFVVKRPSNGKTYKGHFTLRR